MLILSFFVLTYFIPKIAYIKVSSQKKDKIVKFEIFYQKYQCFGRYWQKRGNFEFSTKKRNSIFFNLLIQGFIRKIRKNLMLHFEDLSKKHGFSADLSQNDKFWTTFGQKRSNFEFAKLSLFNVNGAMALWEKSDARISRKLVTYVRMNGRT